MESKEVYVCFVCKKYCLYATWPEDTCHSYSCPYCLAAVEEGSGMALEWRHCPNAEMRKNLPKNQYICDYHFINHVTTKK